MSDADDNQPPRQACDSCRFRKVKCDRSIPCRNCREASLECQYRHCVRRRGPKRGSGRRLTQLRRGLSEFERYPFRVVCPRAAESPVGDAGHGDDKGTSQAEQCRTPSPTQLPMNEGTTDLAAPELFTTPALSYEPMSFTTSEMSNQLSLYLVAHIQVFLKHMFAPMPCIDGDALLRDAVTIDVLPPSRYALILSLCAATRTHLQLDIPENNVEGGPGFNIPPAPSFTGESLLSTAEAALRQVDIIEVENLDAVLSSYFVFAGYGGLNKIRHASFYLNQAISLAQALNLTSEAGYAGLSERDCELRRRTFWLLFATERTFSLQHRRPIMLRNCVAKPEILNTDCPEVMHDFVHHVSLFELLPCSVYDWGQAESDVPPKDSWSQAVTTRLGGFRGEHLVTERQRFETLITQQWLRIFMWRLDFGSRPPANNSVNWKGGGLPIDVGKVVMRALGDVPPEYKDCHGIGLEQKLFDIGNGLVENSPPATLTPPGFGPRDLLFAVVATLSKIRGAQSYLFPTLLIRSKHLLDYADPLAYISTRWPQEADPEASGEDSGLSDFPILAGEALDAVAWAPEFDLESANYVDTWVDPAVEELPL